jgi:hypothetical protein
MDQKQKFIGGQIQQISLNSEGQNLCTVKSVEVVLRHFYRCRHWSSTVVVLLLEGLRSHKVLVIGEYG